MMDSIGQLFEKLGIPQEAEQSYRQALNYNTQFALAHFHLSQMLLAAGRTTEAARELRQFRSLWTRADAAAPEIVAAEKMMRTLSRY